MGIFHPFVPHTQVGLIGVEAAGRGDPGCYHSATVTQGTPGVLHGTQTYLLQTPEGQIEPSHSVAPGLDYPGVGPEHVHLMQSGRVSYCSVQDEQALQAFAQLCHMEGIIPALESSHALAHVLDNAHEFKDQDVLVNLSGRGDKDLDIVINHGI